MRHHAPQATLALALLAALGLAAVPGPQAARAQDNGHGRHGGNVPLGLTGQFGRDAVKVGGSVNLRGRDPGRFDRISLSGRVGRHGTTIRFTAK